MARLAEPEIKASRVSTRTVIVVLQVRIQVACHPVQCAVLDGRKARSAYFLRKTSTTGEATAQSG